MKKMRKLIPAFAMLLVSAIMMSTASFAWFTMNEAVTATGMSVQAQASGSLVISNKPLVNSSTDTTVDLSSATTSLKPITLKVNGEKGEWAIPTDTKGINSTTGSPEAATTVFTADPGSAYYFDKQVYVGVAGAALANQKITVTLTAPVAAAGECYKAYSVAIYAVTDKNAAAWADNATVAWDAKPDAILHVDNAIVGGVQRNVATMDATFTLDSIVGAEGTDAYPATGVKFILRVYIDGALKSNTQKNIISYDYESATGVYDSNTKYYVKSGEVYTLANTTGFENGDALGTGWYTYTKQVTTPTDYAYVNSSDVPVTATILSVEFKAANVTP